jgi:hypothetical protein
MEQLAVEQADSSSRSQADRSLSIELLERSRDHLTNRPNHGREFMPGRERGDRASLRCSKKRVSDAGDDVAKREVFHQAPHLAQPAGEYLDHCQGKLGVRPEQIEAVFSRDKQQRRALSGLGVCRTWPAIERGHVIKRLAERDVMEHLLLPVLGALEDPHDPGGDEIEGLRRFALGEDERALL